MTAPAQWLVRAVANLPDALRPGVFLALIIVLLWFLFVRRGLGALWQALCRGAANAVTVLVGLVLLPEYAMTTARRRRGEAPGRIALVMARPSEMILDGAASLHERHQEKKKRSSKPPWKLSLFVIVAAAAAWITMDSLPAREPAKRDLARIYQHWRDVEVWADVDREHRAASGLRRTSR
jgi:hypothetical protein